MLMSLMHAPGIHCCDRVCEPVPVDDCSGEGSSVDLTKGSYLLERVPYTGSIVSTLYVILLLHVH